MQVFLTQLQALLNAYERSEADSTFYPPEEIRNSIKLAIEDEPLPQSELLEILKAVIIRTPKTANQGFFNQLYGGKEDLAIMADMLVARMNNSMYTYKVAGPHILIEHAVLSKACEVVGFTAGEGVFCPGGSLANLVAMILARNCCNPNIHTQGLDGTTYVAYTSVQGHYSIKKNAGIIGVGRNNVREVAVNERGEMLADDFARLVEQDLAAGLRPFFVNLTAGTTVLGAFDQVAPISAIAKKHGIWLHVDGAYGASVLLSRRRAALLADVQLADSVTWNLHKMMGVPLTCSMLLRKEAGLLTQNFSEVSDYLFQQDADELNPGIKSLQCGRRNDAFKAWALWKQLGNKGMEQRIEKQFQLRDQVVAMVTEDAEFELIMQPALLNVCFRVCFGHRQVDSDRICAALDQQGIGKVGHGAFNGQHFIRLVIVNPDLQPQDLEKFLGGIKTVARDLLGR